MDAKEMIEQVFGGESPKSVVDASLCEQKHKGLVRVKRPRGLAFTSSQKERVEVVAKNYGSVIKDEYDDVELYLKSSPNNDKMIQDLKKAGFETKKM